MGSMKAELSPMMKQYLEINNQNPGTILFFRLGDFYEMFFEDAKLASKELDIVLTGRDCGQEERAPMCGVPYHSCEAYIQRLVEKGYKVAICEQTEDPAKAKGIVKREIVRVITPGTVIEGSMLDEGKNNFLAVLDVSDKGAGICFVDISTGEVYLTELSNQTLDIRINNEIGRFSPSEVLINDRAEDLDKVTNFITQRIGIKYEVLDKTAFDYKECEKRILDHFKIDNLEHFNLQNKHETVCALGAALQYLYKTQMTGLERITNVDIYSDAQFMSLDISTRRNLELVETMRNKERRGTLLWVLDKTKTAMGKRLLRTWIEQPLLSPAKINRRLTAVEELANNIGARQGIMELLAGVHDMERLMTRVIYGSANARDLRALCHTCSLMPSIRHQLSFAQGTQLKEVYECIDLLDDITELIERAIDEDPPVSVREGGIIREGYNEDLDELRRDISDGKGLIAKIEAKERQATGINKLKVGYNKVFGYYIEVTKSNLDMVPDHYIRKQTLANCERFITQELKKTEERVLGAHDKITALEYEIFEKVRKEIAGQLHRIQRTAHAIATLDVLCSFAYVAVSNDFCKPIVNLDGKIIIKEGRHPVVESMVKTSPFVPNDTLMDNNDNRVQIITGPNMAGKSTYMRQVALITLMAQIGSFVPAQSAEIGIVDSIFTRIGASDDLSAGQSTFMVEMNEVANILGNATKDSLLILDEIGRGTSTYDGMAIARAVLEHCADKKKLGAKTLFATHYHELTDLEEQLDGVKNYNIAVKKRGDEITFLRRIVRGGADESFGIEVAKLAGVPESTVTRAKQILRQLESGDPVYTRKSRAKKTSFEEAEPQISLMPSPGDEIAKELKDLDLNTLTPIEAFNILYKYKSKLKN